MSLSRRHFIAAAAGLLAVPTARAQPQGNPMQAYDVEMEPHSIGDDDARGDGWAFGLPPDIGTAAWPLDRNNGYPLQHGFTIRLPEDYRVHGPQIVALSFFATAFDHNDGGPMITPAIHALLKQDNPAQPEDLDLLPFWQARQSEHRRLFRMRDILSLDYAVILLDEQEFSGAFTTPPDLRGNRHLDAVAPPGWLTSGGGKAFWEASYFGGPVPPTQTHIYNELGGIPEAGQAFNRAIRISPRAVDPNAGIAPQDGWLGQKGDYQQPYDAEKDFALRKWTKGHLPNHIGGTMRPAQAVPSFSPYYIEFEESFGGYNFGSGNAQLDFKDMKFDWAQ